jgi:hypothetical protein
MPSREPKRHCDLAVLDYSKHLLDLPPQPLADPLPGFPEPPGPYPALAGGEGDAPAPLRTNDSLLLVPAHLGAQYQAVPSGLISVWTRLCRALASQRETWASKGTTT